MGAIPARAGEPKSVAGTVCISRGYPRAGGGTHGGIDYGRCYTGLSPRGRGNQLTEMRLIANGGAIPARAGEPRSPIVFRRIRRGYPRAGGGTNCAALISAMVQGLSPRGRGNRRHGDRLSRRVGAIPARAGEPSASRRARGSAGGYPRAGGGTGGSAALDISEKGLSPRGRGNRGRIGHHRRGEGAIPARAGEPPPAPGAARGSRGYPRAGGGTLLLVERELPL